MKKINFPVLACFIGVFLLILLLKAGAPGEPLAFPLLTLLFMSELGFLVTGAGAVFGIKAQLAKGLDVRILLPTLVCAVLAIVLALKGFAFWSSMNAG